MSHLTRFFIITLLWPTLVWGAQARRKPDLDAWLGILSARFDEAMRNRQYFGTYTYENLAGDIGFSGAAVSKIRHGINPMSLDAGQKISARLGVSVEWLMAFDVLDEMFRHVTLYDLKAIERRHKGHLRPTIYRALEVNDLKLGERCLPLEDLHQGSKRLRKAMLLQARAMRINR